MKRACSMAVAMATAMLGACEKNNPEYCLGEEQQSDPYCAGDAMPAGCTSNDECSGGGASVCELTSGTCVQCLGPDQVTACSGTTPVCGDDHACRMCSVHSECASNACLPDGSCAAESDVAYVSPTGSGTQCTRAAPCGTLAEAVATERPIAKMATGTVKVSAVTMIDGKKITILAEPGAKLTRDTNGPILQVQSANADVSIVGLEISGQSGTADSAIIVTANGGTPTLSLSRCVISGNQGIGISANGGSLTVSRSTVSLNSSGGISVGVGTTIDITNNFIFRNGDPSNGTLGGVSLGVANGGSNRFEFNTVVDNFTSLGTAGVACIAPTFATPNNIIARNSVAGSTSDPAAQTSTNGCAFGTSKIQADVAGLGFVDPDAPAPIDYHLTAGSSAVDQASMSTVTVDFDGDARPTGAASDLGADELAP